MVALPVSSGSALTRLENLYFQMSDSAVHSLSPVFVGSDVYRRPAYGGNHPLAIKRVETAVDLCSAFGWLEGAWRASPRASREQLTVFQTAEYIDALHSAEMQGKTPAEHRLRFNIGTRENPVFAGVFERAATSVGGSILAARLALEGRIAYHPAGGTHHGRADRASGFCYFNDPVFAILEFLASGLTRILYVDLDAHHGDGVEHAFAQDKRVHTISLHEAGRWPHTGLLDDRRGGQARNLPVPRQLNDSEFGLLIDKAVMPLARRCHPQAVVLTCGADCLRGDPLSAMELSNGALWDAAVKIANCASASVVLGGGGYNPWTVARAWAGLWALLSGFDIPPGLPESAQKLLTGLECDLVDDEDRRPEWLTTLADAPNEGAIRDEIRVIAARSLE